MSSFPGPALGHPHSTPPYRPDIDGLRALAVLSVIGYHAFPDHVRGGFAGVDVFFVISGFLITSIIARGLAFERFSFTGFYAHRVRRIFPGLAAVLAAVYLAGFAGLWPDEFATLGKHVAAGAAFIQNQVLIDEAGYFDIASDRKPLLHLWSLAVEEQFYIVYPFLVWGAWQRGKRWARIRPFGVIAVLALLSLGANLAFIGQHATVVFFSLWTRFWELAAGGLFALSQHPSGVAQESSARSVARAGWREGAAVLGLVLILWADFGLRRSRPYPGAWALVPVLGALLLVATGPTTRLARSVLGHRYAVALGLISYPLYLWHWPLLSMARISWGSEPPAAVRLGLVAASVVLAWLTYRFVERPVRFGSHRTRRGLVAAAGLGAIGLLGLAASAGVPPAWHRQDPNAVAPFVWTVASADPGCQATVGTTVGTYEGYCLASGPKRPGTVALIGDSHAEALYPGLSRALARTDRSTMLLGGSGCVPFRGLASRTTGAPDVCSGRIAKALDFVEARPAIDTVVLASRGPVYLTGTGFGDAERERAPWLIGSATAPGAARPAVFSQALDQTLAELTRAGKTVVVVLDVPELGFDPRSCVTTHPWQPGSPRAHCSVSRAEFDGRNEAYRKLVEGVVARHPGVLTFDAAALFCGPDQCDALEDGALQYRDDNHLSLIGSERVGAALAATLSAARSRP